jgi:chromosome segregation ATPase
MNRKLEEESKLDAKLKKLDRDIEGKNKKLVELNDKIIEKEDKLTEIREEVKKLEQDKIDAAAEVADYIKKKMDIKERNDRLEAKEKYLRKRFEEAGINFD